MELKELTDKTLELFNVKSTDELIEAIKKNYNNTDIMQQFCDLVKNDLDVDWLQKIYQYYEADRKNKGQDYTPQTLADLMAKLAETNDDHVIPILIFNLAIRNIDATVNQEDFLSREVFKTYRIEPGERFGKVTAYDSSN